MLIGLGEDIHDPYWLSLLGQRVGSQGDFCKKCKHGLSRDMDYLENCLSQTFYISHADWSWWEHDPDTF